MGMLCQEPGVPPLLSRRSSMLEASGPITLSPCCDLSFFWRCTWTSVPPLVRVVANHGKAVQFDSLQGRASSSRTPCGKPSATHGPFHTRRCPSGTTITHPPLSTAAAWHLLFTGLSASCSTLISMARRWACSNLLHALGVRGERR